MDEEQGAHEQTGQGKGVADDFQGRAGGAQGRRGDVRPAEVVDDDADDDVEGGDDGLAEHEGAAVVGGVAHFGGDGEEGRGAGVGEDDGGEGGDGAVEVGAADDLVVGDPDAVLRGGGGTVLDADADGHDHDWGC